MQIQIQPDVIVENQLMKSLAMTLHACAHKNSGCLVKKYHLMCKHTIIPFFFG